MSTSAKRITCCFITGITALLFCVAIWSIGIVVLGIPQASERLGNPAPDLNPVFRTFLSGYLLANEAALDSPAGQIGVSIELEVQEGDSAGDVIDRLTETGVISDGFLLRNYLRYRGFDVSVEAGHYQLSGDMSVRQIADALQTARPASVTFTVLEGWRLEEIAERIALSGLNIGFDEFLVVCHYQDYQIHLF